MENKEYINRKELINTLEGLIKEALEEAENHSQNDNEEDANFACASASAWQYVIDILEDGN